MKVKWLGHASFLITSESGTRIITDPYEQGFRGLINYEAIGEEADVVTVSHEHGDHNAVAAVAGSPQVVRGEGKQNAAGLEFEGFPAYHDKVEGRERGRNTIMRFTVDGVRCCHLGDLGHALSEEEAARLRPVDVLFIPVGGPAATLEQTEAWQVCQRVDPRLIIPMHFRNDKCSFPKYSVTDFVEGKGNVETSGATEVEIRASALPRATQVLVLRNAL